MRKVFTLPAILAFLPATIGLVGCGSNPKEVTSYQRAPSSGVSYSPGAQKNYVGASFAGQPNTHYPQATKKTSVRPAPSYQLVTTSSSNRASVSGLLAEVKVRKDFMSTSARGRRDSTSMKPRYITIHSTQNWSQGADAWRHSLALKNSKLGKLSWHFTVDENVAVQHLPTNITGRHADFDGPGNHYSIGIEMCEHPGNSRARTLERTAKLAAYLMYKYDIPIAKVVPHYHWPRYGMHPEHKNCPHFLLDNGRPGAKWRAFQNKVQSYYKDISRGGSVYVSR